MTDRQPAAPAAFQFPDTEKVLAGLKPFQRRSVDYVFQRLYGPGYTRRFLLADEVGLGKTLVAKGVIARAIEHLRHRVRRIDVVYICSNHDIARQNINRLNLTGRDDYALASRITLLPIRGGNDRHRLGPLNFVSFTPSTSFDLKSRLGVSEERVLLYHLLREAWQLRGAAPLYVLRGDKKINGFRRHVENFPQEDIDREIAAMFVAEAAKTPRLQDEFAELCGCYRRTRDSDAEWWERRNALIGELRELLARTCLDSLEPDLIILDEFQRFKHLLRESDSAEAQLAHKLFRYSDEESSDEHSQARVLLLSATPYKMYTLSQESGEDDHYQDFLDTVRFLLDDAPQTERVESLLADYRRQLYGLAAEDTRPRLGEIRRELERCLRGVMCRTERLAVTADRSGMLRQIDADLDLEPGDVQAYMGLQKIARQLEHHDTVEYWKSAPYLLNFMEHYQLKQEFCERVADPCLCKAVQDADRTGGTLLPWAAVRRYREVAPQNPRLRELMRQTVDAGAWQLLWIPPALPYYDLPEPFAEPAAARFTKRLVFSSWHVVPKAVATLLSYEAERRMVTSFRADTEYAAVGKAIRRLLEFRRSRGDLAGMPVLGLLYPSFFLAEHVDPLRVFAAQVCVQCPDLDGVIAQAKSAIAEFLESLTRNAPSAGAEDKNWYWAAPILLDQCLDPTAAQEWFADESLSALWSGLDYDKTDRDEEPEAEERDDAGWPLHVQHASELLRQGPHALGRPPTDLPEVVAQLAVAGPAVAALRALGRVSGGAAVLRDPQRRHAAGRIAWGFRALFNSPDVIALIRGRNRAEPYWRRVLDYCADGCLQAVLDEYAHVLRDSLGDTSADETKAARDVAEAMSIALNLRVANPGADRIEVDDAAQQVRIDSERLRARFAMRFGDERSDDGQLVSRKEHVRQAFNSPFWPFVLVTTSIGQEGLDFHTYCRAVVHWNLPANPVDMEQREGRVHRYKGHAVRWNVALRHGASLRLDGHLDPWCELFAAAAESGPETSDATGLWPYWVCAADGGVTIERHVPALPLSREAEHLPALRNSLAVYRMVFGQPRQDDLVAYLLDRLTPSEIEQHLDRLRIDLSPPIVDLIAAGLGPCAEAEFAAEADDQVEWAPAGAGLSAASGDSTADDQAPDEETGPPSSAGDPGRNPPPPIWETERVDVMATIREVFSSGGPRDREQAFRDVAVALGYQRTGSRIREVLNRDIQTAVRRGILDNRGGQLSLLCRSIDQYTLDHLIDMLLAAMGGTWWDREQAIIAAARHLGFRRTGHNVRAAFKSAINAAIRRGLLERGGADEIRKTR